MKNVKTPTSDSWSDALIQSLKNPERAVGYIEAVLEEKNPEPELLSSALKDVIAARLLCDNLSEEAKQHFEKLDTILSETGGTEIYTLVEFLDALGFRIAIIPKD
ncbi:transcriptional regulator [Scytonema sp. UIC 10036]|uniref:helix-turn-helix domain-containing transcriptional regulator n=1 Tax=Scytonema sp. UIC 10036 TaxID=2304196 RepID=UPI0012DAA7D2|nr:transcriptional regulator [Scytonema sp. UIC 10036]MUG91984.1 transcriptional regulator [Scytonema sp. UIC 10036]